MRPVALALTISSLAWADDRTLLYVNPAPLVTASRLQALGGAAVGLAENSESLPFNYATADITAPVESQFGGLVQFNRFGIGAYGRVSTKGVCTAMSGCMTASANQW